MKRPSWFPPAIGNQVIWLRNFKTKLPNHATTPLALVPADVTARLLDTDNAIYALETYRGAAATFPDAAYQRVEDALHNDQIPGNIIWLDFAPPSPAPAAVTYGCLQRLFAYIDDVIKKSPGYDTAIGNDLGTEAPTVAAPAPTTFPEFTLRATSGDKAEALWPKGQFDGVKIEVDRGTAGLLTDTDLRPNYTLNWLPPAGTSAIIKMRMRYIYKGEEFGNWSPWQQWTLTGA